MQIFTILLGFLSTIVLSQWYYSIIVYLAPGSESVLQIVKLTLNFIRPNRQRLQVALALHVRGKIAPSMSFCIVRYILNRLKFFSFL